MNADEKKASYKAKMREQEIARREALGMSAYNPNPVRKAKRSAGSARPLYGSQQWAETYRDDLGESFD